MVTSAAHSFSLEPPCFHGVVALQRKASTSVERTNVASCAERLKCDVFNDVTVFGAKRLSALPHTLSHIHTHVYSAPVTHTFVDLAHMQTHLTFPSALPTLQILTDGDVKAVNAESGTPTLPKSMLLRVSFHCLGTPPVTLASFNLF